MAKMYSDVRVVLYVCRLCVLVRARIFRELAQHVLNCSPGSSNDM